VAEAGRVPGENGFDVRIVNHDASWRVEIVGPDGRVESDRTCRDGDEARIFASTVRQHIYWLSGEKFREYYRLGSEG
jgi:hypothetical protein